jgi:mitochondrial fission protein ELM1
MRILSLADRRTGHVRQCQGLVRTIARDRTVEVVELPVRPARFATDLVRRLAARMDWISADAVLSHVYGLEPSDVTGFDLVIGSGRPTILAGIAISRLAQTRFIYCGRTSGYAADAFGLVLVPYRGEDHLPRHVFAPIPSPIDPADYAPPRPLTSLETLAGASITLLVGGPSTRRAWTMPDWGHLAYFLVAAEHELGIKWSIATSPRTPEAARGLLAATFSQLETAGDFVDFHLAGPGSADPLFAADAICVTSDSTSMIAEGLAALRPVIGLATRRLKASRDDQYLADLARDGSFADVSLTNLKPAQFAAALVGLKSPESDPRDRLRLALADVLKTID